MASILSTAFRDAYDIAFQVSPIIFTGGLFAGAPGAAMPIIGLIGQAGAAGLSLLQNGASMSDFYARFEPLPGATTIANQIGTYPFANQQIAANAIITMPLTISLRMIVPIKPGFGYPAKLATFTALRESFASHNAAAGTYSIATPSYIYTSCIMTGLTDITSEPTHQQQIEWQLDFVQPLVTVQQVQVTLNAAMQKISGGQVNAGSWIDVPNVPQQGALKNVSQMAGAVIHQMAQPLP